MLSACSPSHSWLVAAFTLSACPGWRGSPDLTWVPACTKGHNRTFCFPRDGRIKERTAWLLFKMQTLQTQLIGRKREEAAGRGRDTSCKSKCPWKRKRFTKQSWKQQQHCKGLTQTSSTTMASSRPLCSDVGQDMRVTHQSPPLSMSLWLSE